MERPVMLPLAERNESSALEKITLSDALPREGVLAEEQLQLPEFERFSFFAPFQPNGFAVADNRWPDGTNRTQPLAGPASEMGKIETQGLFLLLKIDSGNYMALLPLPGPQTMSWLERRDENLFVVSGNFGSGKVSGEIPLLGWASASDPYDACFKLWQTILKDDFYRANTTFRDKKTYPDMFKYLGWCSWEHFRQDITGENLKEAVDMLNKSEIPVRYALIDDGHLKEANGQLIDSAAPNDKFPEGWKPVFDQRREDRVKWFGLWLNFNGYWNAIHPENQLGIDDNLQNLIFEKIWGREAISNAKVPKPGLLSSLAFYLKMIGDAARFGFDFVKVDNQARNLTINKAMEQPVTKAAGNSRALETACASETGGLINCMAHNSICLFNTRRSAVTRCSEDYLMGDKFRAKGHLYNSYVNMSWLGYTVWGDHDMFHSSDPESGRMMAISKAMSGGPVYLSDVPDGINPDFTLPLCYNDGELLRPLAPAAALPESLFISPAHENEPFRAIAPLTGGAAAVAVYNLTEPDRAIQGYISADDYRNAGIMIQPQPEKWEIPPEELVIYDWYSGKARKIGREPYTFGMADFTDRLFMLCPVRDGWAAIGRPDKYLSPAATEILSSDENSLLLKVAEGGEILIWKDSGEPVSENCKVTKIDDSFFKAETPRGRDLAISFKVS